MRRSTALWFVLALLGICVAAGLTVVASRVAAVNVGLSDEPISIGDELAPPRTQESEPRRHSTKRPAGTQGEEPAPAAPVHTAPAPAPSPTSTEDHSDDGSEVEDDADSGRGRGRGRGGDEHDDD